jgi:hypothetical protein
MRVLFFMAHPGYARNFESVLWLLAERGHEVHCAVDRRKTNTPDEAKILDRLVAAHPSVSYGESPQRESWPWPGVAKALRVATDYVRYLEPRYRDATKLRQRAAERVPRWFRFVISLPLARRSSSVAVVLRFLRALERHVPPDPAVVEFVRRRAPDLVLVTPLVEIGSRQGDYVRAARVCGVPSALPVFSWDNLTNKGLVRDAPDLVVVWNESQKAEAVELHGVPVEDVAVCGASGYDQWFNRSPSRSRSEFCAELGLPATRPIVLYLASSPFIAPDEADFVRRWLADLRRLGAQAVRQAAVVVRPHPLCGPEWGDLDLGDLGPAVVWPPQGANPTDDQSKADYFDSLYHASVVVGINTTAQIESGILGRPVLTVLAPEHRETQEGTLHFQHLVNVEGGLLEIAESMDEHARQVEQALEAPDRGTDRSRRFVKAFVRPHGLENPATPLVVDALERRAQARVDPRPTPWALRPLLFPLAIAPGVWGEARMRSVAPGFAKSVYRALRRRAGRVLARRDAKASYLLGSLRDHEIPTWRVARHEKRLWTAFANGRPIIAGPWTSEVGYELLYWIPMLRWLVEREPALAERLVILSRGGTELWYEGICNGYVDILDDLTPEEYLRLRSSAHDEHGGKQKQVAMSPLDQRLLDAAWRRLGVEPGVALHPLLMFTIFRWLRWQSAVHRMMAISRYERLAPPPLGDLAGELPDDYVAVRFYFNASLPGSETNQTIVDGIVDTLAARANVVMLNPEIRMDEHTDFRPAASRIVNVDHLMTPRTNLDVQTRIIANAKAFVGTYGGLSYLAPFYGVDSLSLYSERDAFHAWHLELAQRVFADDGWGAFLALDLTQAKLVALAAEILGTGDLRERIAGVR